ncbi:hypothetical protein [Salarchaeum sp. JOR-1]|uniref:hypothetical protein n=1 Tax=Salarchaeum sp. JOR-1 TaxID=2599399 RepID=UPI001198C134|nr:hypothetical protein [Salarchaeum sp. JOR-1]QDX39844.1 hypothetical protein FQU85_02620 [Salarchaeum sp. JOR-1]
MDLASYLPDKEPKLLTTTAFEGEYGDSKGNVTLTPKRLVYLNSGSAVDISLDRLDAIEFDKARIPRGLFWMFLATVAVTIGTFLIVPELSNFPLSQMEATAIPGAFAVLYALLCLWYRRATLSIHTASGSWEFTGPGTLQLWVRGGDKLDEFPNKIRSARR